MDKKENKNKKITEFIMVTLIMIFYIIYGIHFIPLLLIFIPVPYIILGVRNGIYLNLLSTILTFVIVGIFLGATIGMFLVLVVVPLSVSINYCIEKRKTSKQTLLIASLALLIPIVILIILGIKSADIDLISELDNIVTQYMSIQLDFLRGMDFATDEILEKAEQWESIYNEIIILIPSIISIFSVLITSINYFFVGIILREMGYELIKRPRLSRFQLPRNIFLGAGIMLLACFIFKWLNIEYSQALFINISFIIGIMFLIQGLGVFDFLLKKIKLKVGFRIIFIILIMLFLPMGSIIIFIGMFDSIFDMRKLRRAKS